MLKFSLSLCLYGIYYVNYIVEFRIKEGDVGYFFYKLYGKGY